MVAKLYRHKWLLVIALVLSVSMLVVVGCGGGGADDATPAPAPTATTAPAPTAPPTQPAGKPTAAAIQQPAPTAQPVPTAARPPTPAAPTGIRPSTCMAKGTQMSDCPLRSAQAWKPATAQQAGIPWLYHKAYTGPKPTQFFESPMSAALVKAGKLPPVEQRLPVPDDVSVVAGPDGIGTYGGYYRWTDTGNYIGEFIVASWNVRDSNETDWNPWVGKSWSVSQDGRVWTFKLRRGLKWSDGTPFTMDDIRFAWEDNNFNKDLNASFPLEWSDPVTAKPPTFTVVDNATWTLTYDTSNFIIMESRSTPSNICNPGGVCMFAHPKMKKYYPKYNTQAEIDKYIKEFGVTDWKGLISNRFQIYNNMTEIGCLAPWCAISTSDRQTEWERNHYYPFVDPEGNQLPYIDGALVTIVESRDVAVFRALAGEMDFRTSMFQMGELPLYIQNMERGDYSIYHWPATGGSDLPVSLAQDWNGDPEIGRLIRTRDFRLALSHAMNRDSINQKVMLGIAVVQNRVPRPSNVYYPGAEFATKNIQYDVAKANQLLDSLGLNKKDSAGFRLRADGKRLHLDLVVGTTADVVGTAELVKSQWEAVGVETGYRALGNAGALVRKDKTEYGTIFTDASSYQHNPWMVQWTTMAPLSVVDMSPRIGEWYSSKGANGMSKAPDAAYLPPAPAGRFPADPSGNLQKLSDTWIEGVKYAKLDPKRIELGKELFRINVNEMFMLHTVAFSGNSRGVFISRNNVRNKPISHERDHNGFSAWTYFFEDGKDNYHHPGNKSTRCKSWVFTQGGSPQCS